VTSQLQLDSLQHWTHVTTAAAGGGLLKFLLPQPVQLLHGCCDAARCELVQVDAEHCLQLQQAITRQYKLQHLLHMLLGMHRPHLLLGRRGPSKRHVLLLLLHMVQLCRQLVLALRVGLLLLLLHVGLLLLPVLDTDKRRGASLLLCPCRQAWLWLHKSSWCWHHMASLAGCSTLHVKRIFFDQRRPS
jgi:hypothetical protein